MTDFIEELEKNISNIGASILWKRKIGGSVVWFAPITLHGQEKVSEFIGSADETSIAVLHETKRLTLSHAIVGINDIDLRQYRESAPSLPMTGKDGKTTKVSLEKYLHAKIINWSAQFVDDAFAVYADLVESLQKENLEEIKFENTKTPQQELEELESRVAILRETLGMQPLVEKAKESVSEPTSEMDVASTDSDPVEMPFDPFSKIANSSDLPKPPVTESPKIPARVESAPSPAPNDLGVKSISDDNDELFKSVPENSEVIDKRATVTRSAPIINEVITNKNPAFMPNKR